MEVSISYWKTLGYPEIVTNLKQICKLGSIPNSLIISGPEHTGKTTLALDISKSINCIKGSNNQSEDKECECDQCKRINSYNHPDVLIVNRESICSSVNERESCKNCGSSTNQTVIPICVIRDLVLGRSQTKPFYGLYQVTILEDAHLLRKDSIDHLLKVLEEGNPNLLLILLASSIDLLPLTIKSRCQSYKLFPITHKSIKKLLTNHFPEKNDALNTIARLSGGCYGKAVNLIRHPILLDNQNQTVERIFQLFKNPLSYKLKYSNDLSNLYKKNKESVQNELDCWSNWCRDILMIQSNQNDKILYIKYLEQTKEIASKISLNETLVLLRFISSLKETLNMNVNPLVAFDMMIKHIPRNI